jgi:hypothetical protein
MDAWRDQDLAELEDLPPDALTILHKPFLPHNLIEKVGQLIGSARGCPASVQPGNSGGEA